MIKMDLLVNGKSWIDLLKEKNFQMVITKINAQEIARVDSYIYLKALLYAEWNKVMEYVKQNSKY